MRTLILLPGLLLFFGLKGAGSSMDLGMALKKGLVKASVSARGGYSGKCLTIRLSSHSRDSLMLRLEPGRRFKAQDSTRQDLLLVKERVFLLGPFGTVSADLEGYCCQASNKVPQASDRYGTGSMADSNLVKLASFLNRHEFEGQAMQQAVWALSDDRPAAGISGKADSLLLPLRQFVAALKGEELPWYSIHSTTLVYKSGRIRVIPMRLQGQLSYTLAQHAYVTLSVTNEQGLAVGIIKSFWFQASAAGTYRLELPLSGLEKGKYCVALETGGRRLCEKAFEI